MNISCLHYKEVFTLLFTLEKKSNFPSFFQYDSFILNKELVFKLMVDTETMEYKKNNPRLFT